MAESISQSVIDAIANLENAGAENLEAFGEGVKSAGEASADLGRGLLYAIGGFFGAVPGYEGSGNTLMSYLTLYNNALNANTVAKAAIAYKFIECLNSAITIDKANGAVATDALKVLLGIGA